jgi:hypothetical protein
MTKTRRAHYAHYRQHGANYCERCYRFREWAMKSGHKELL